MSARHRTPRQSMLAIVQVLLLLSSMLLVPGAVIAEDGLDTEAAPATTEQVETPATEPAPTPSPAPADPIGADGERTAQAEPTEPDELAPPERKQSASKARTLPGSMSLPLTWTICRPRVQSECEIVFLFLVRTLLCLMDRQRVNKVECKKE